jgi:hypothetical protein
MLNDKLQFFHQKVLEFSLEVGNNAPRIADRIISEVFPRTNDAAEEEGADTMLRNGVIAYLTKYLKRHDEHPEAQASFADIDESFQPIVKRLQSQSHYVPNLQQHIPVAMLIANPEWLDEARAYKRQKGEETLAEAAVLDELYEAVMS